MSAEDDMRRRLAEADRNREHEALQESYDTLRKEFAKSLETIDRLSKQLEMHPAQTYIRAAQLAEPIFVALHDALLDCADDNGVLREDEPVFVPRTITEAYKVGLVSQARDALTCAVRNDRTITVGSIDTDALRERYDGNVIPDELDNDVIKMCDEVDRLRAQIERAQRKVRPA